MGPTWGPSGADRTQVGPMLAPWTLLSGVHAKVIAASPIKFPVNTWDNHVFVFVNLLLGVGVGGGGGGGVGGWGVGGGGGGGGGVTSNHYMCYKHCEITFRCTVTKRNMHGCWHHWLSANILYQKTVAFDKPICPIELLGLHQCHTRNGPQNNG